MTNRFDRRKFLVGAGSAALAIPMLEAFAPRAAFGQTMAPPRRLLVIYHQDGRLFGDGSVNHGVRNDWWSPAAAGPLPVGAPASPLLAPLQAVRNEIVTVDGVDNLVRHLYSDADAHLPAQKALLTCRKGAGSTTARPAAPSFDYVMGQRLRATGSTQPPAIVMFGTAADYTWRANNLQVFFGANGTPPWFISPDPAAAISELFGAPGVTPRSPRVGLQQRLAGQRNSVLDGVLDNFRSLKGRVNATDREKLESHAEFVRQMELASSAGGGTTSGGGAGGGAGPTGGGGGSTGGGGGTAPSRCTRPSESAVPSNLDASGSAYLRGERDAVMMPAIIENVVQAFACDVTRVASLMFWQGDDPIFPTEFGGTSPFASSNWHGVIHNVPRIYDSAASQQNARDLTASYHHFGKTFATLVQRMAAFIEPDGSRMLDNTLILMVSEMGYGSTHAAHNLPIVLGGLRSAFPRGQGRHVVENRRSMGDLLAHVMRMFGGSDQAYGETGTLGAHGFFAPDAGAPGYVNASTPLHSGPLDL